MTSPSPEPEQRDSVPPPLSRLFAALNEPGALTHHDEDQARALIKAALDEALEGSTPNDRTRRRAKVKGRKFVRVWLMAAFVFAAGGVLAAVGRQYWAAQRAVEDAGQRAAGGEHGASETRSNSDHAAPSVSPIQDPAPSNPAVERAAPPARPDDSRTTPTPEGNSQAPSSNTGKDLLAEANRLRRSGRLAEAVRVYSRVVERAPSSQSAYVARVAAAQLLLGSAPEQALVLFRQAHKSRPTGPLEREIQRGIEQATKRAPRQ